MNGSRKLKSSVRMGKFNLDKLCLNIDSDELCIATLDEIENNTKKDPEAVAVRRIIRARMADQRRKSREKQRIYTSYLNRYFLSLIASATGYKSWTSFEKSKLKRIRRRIEEIYSIPVNYYQVFVYRTVYKYLKWDKHNIMYSNFVGFMNSEFNIINCSKFLSSRSMMWRYRYSTYPSEYKEKWGKPVPIRYQKIGINDMVVKHDLHSDFITKRINRFK